MRLHIISDIHTDSHSEDLRQPPGADLTILAGDWCNGTAIATRGLRGFEFEKPVVAILGNHEWYA